MLSAFGVTSAQRSTAPPDVPTIAESGLKNYICTTWYGVWAPARTPAAIVNRVNQAIQKVSGQADVRTSLQNAGIEPEGSTPAQFGDLVRADLAKWSKLIRDAGIKAQ